MKIPSLLGWFAAGQRRRTVRSTFSAGLGYETLENRQLLSAANQIPAPQEEIAAYDLNGMWDLEFENEDTAIADVTQNGKKATVVVDLDDLGEVTLKGKSSKDDPNFYSVKGSVKTDEGKFNVNVNAAASSNMALEGTLEVLMKKEVVQSLDFAGEKILASAVPLADAFTAAGNWEIEFDDNQLGVTTADASVTEKGKKGKLTATVMNETLGTIKLKGSRNSEDANTLNLTGKVKTEIGKLDVVANLELSSNDVFEGTISVGNFIIDVAGARITTSGVPLKVTPPNVAGLWTLEFEPNDLDIEEATLDVTQNGLKITALIDADVLDEPIAIKGKINKKLLTELIAKGKVPVGNFNLKVVITINANDPVNPTSFDGNIYRSVFGNEVVNVDFSGVKNV